jgi:hypothetical protein
MLGTLYQSSDVVSTSFAAATIATFATAALLSLGLTWAPERWRIPVVLSAVALTASGLQYLDAGQVWAATGKTSAAFRFAAWFAVHPLQVAAVYFFANIAGPVSVGVFWRTVAAAGLMVLCRYLGDAHIFNATLGVLLSIAFWLYILGEMYFGRMSEVVQKASRPMRVGYFWIRLNMTIGWAIIPILHFVDVVIGTGQAAGVIVLYTLADLLNLIVPCLAVLAVAGKERVTL